MCCKNIAVAYIANNLVFHEKIKHIKVDYHYVKKLIKKLFTVHVAFEKMLQISVLKRYLLDTLLNIVTS